MPLDGKDILSSEEADYLGMRININRGFICKDPKDLLEKGKPVAVMLTLEKWFSLSLNPRHLANIYETHVRSLVLYESELLMEQERRPLEEIDDERVRTFFIVEAEKN